MFYRYNFYFNHLTSYGCSDKVMINCPDNNYMSKKNINTENYYQNRRELKTTLLSKSDFDISYDEFEISCTELLSDHLFVIYVLILMKIV